MSFWDSSAITPIVIREARTPQVDQLYAADRSLVVWWSTPVECRSAIERRLREGTITPEQARRTRARLAQLFHDIDEVEPTTAIRADAERLLEMYPLRTADALQLAAALTSVLGTGSGHGFVCLDRRLRAAAQAEGFALLPTTL